MIFNLIEENEADEIAAEYILPKKDYHHFIHNTWNGTEASILNFAKSINIHPGIIVGRLQHDKIAEYNKFHKLKVALN